MERSKRAGRWMRRLAAGRRREGRSLAALGCAWQPVPRRACADSAERTATAKPIPVLSYKPGFLSAPLCIALLSCLPSLLPSTLPSLPPTTTPPSLPPCPPPPIYTGVSGRIVQRSSPTPSRSTAISATSISAGKAQTTSALLATGRTAAPLVPSVTTSQVTFEVRLHRLPS